MKPIRLSAYTLATCLGAGLEATREALRTGASGLRSAPFDTLDLETYTGQIEGLEQVCLPTALAAYDCRNNRAAERALRLDGFEQAVAAASARHGPARIGVFIGTSTAGILQTEQAYRRRDPADGSLPPGFDYRGTQNTFSVATFVRARLRLEGPCSAVSTACSSSAKVFASAQRFMRAGLIDAAVVGGVDTLCLTTLYGFNSLQLLSREPCRPYDARRDGISIGEGAAFILLERADDAVEGEGVWLLGAGESCDAHHMSAPHPEGLGARLAMSAALEAAGLGPGDVDYVNLHGTGTPSNDAAEDKAVVGLLGSAIPCSSTKGMTGHTLGAAGAVEAILTVLALADGRIPGSAGTREVDPALGACYQKEGRPAALAVGMSNSFGFGGSNCSLVFGRLPRAA
ncbi:MAG TPA: beta-ketoacyl-[acyl-carrier-protein] synthase family protein [Usitatibacter sp.]|nr:beta-ketoacyl-[acyl-carrier-protein] synthase family protein [Usitatibacter sp.]